MHNEITMSQTPQFKSLTLNVRGPSYLGLTRSISWLLMPWLLTSPGHQQPWYWLYTICRSFSYLRTIWSTCVISMWRNDTKCECTFMFSVKTLARKGLTISNVFRTDNFFLSVLGHCVYEVVCILVEFTVYIVWNTRALAIVYNTIDWKRLIGTSRSMNIW